MSLKGKLVCVLLPLFLIVFAVHSVVVYRATYNDIITDLEREAHNIRNVLMSTRRIYHHQFIDSGLPVNDDTIGFLPAHAMGRISNDFQNWADSGLTFRNVSDRARNPANAADESELAAMDYFRQNPEVKDRFILIQEEQPLYHFTEPIYIEQYCLQCHGSQDDAPLSIASRYPEAYDYELGDLRGVMSIKLPVGIAQSRAQAALIQNLSINLIVYLAVFVAIYMLLTRYAVRPLRTLVKGSEELAAGNYTWRSGITGSDEIAGIAATFDRMTTQIGDRDSQLRKSEERFRCVAETAADAIITCDTTGRIVSWNRAAEHIFGYTENEACAERVNVLIPEFLEGEHEQKFQEAVSSDEISFVNGRMIEGIGLRKDGTRFPVQVSLSAWDSGEERLFTAIVRDTTESKILEEQLLQSQKMDAVGQLAGGVAHDFNNLLQVIEGYSGLALENQKSGKPVDEDLKEVMEASGKAVTLVRQLLAFSRRQVLELKTIDLSHVVEVMGKMIERIIGEHIAFVIQADPDSLPIQADEGLIEQVIMNLCVNARDAMPEGGVLTIKTANMYLDEDFFEAGANCKAGDYAVLSVTDTGIGMDEETQQHIFEPFFTTKPTGKGTGLGMSTVFGIVAQHRGTIRVYSEADKGSTMRVYLPAAERPAPVEEAVEAQSTQGGTETILVADDDSGVRKLATLLLETAGYNVIEASDGEEAIREFDAHVDEIDMVLLDVVMPKRSGKAVFDYIRKTRPNVRVLFASGYDSGTVHTDFVLGEDFQLIQKPYRKASFLSKVREVLN